MTTDVRAIIEDVATRGAEAVCEYTRRFDQVDVSPDDLVYDPFAIDTAPPAAEIQAAIEYAAARIRRFHRASRPAPVSGIDSEPGLSLSERWVPLRRAGVYAPNGEYPLVSSLLMTAIPAQEAGVEGIAVAISPRADSRRDPIWNFALRHLGIHQVLAAGGAQAIAALAYGVGPLSPVDIVAGPGNRYVAEAKQILFERGAVGIDLLAGPSEVMVVADGTADPRWVALDLLSQAEHAADASGVLVTWDPDLAQAVEREVEAARAAHPLRAAGPIRYQQVADAEAALVALNRAAPEHAGLIGAAAEALAPRVTTAGALFIGALAGQALGDYVAGPSHVLPTQRTGRFLSGLSTRTFMRRMSIVEARTGITPELFEQGAVLAGLEGLLFHQAALTERRSALPEIRSTRPKGGA